MIVTIFAFMLMVRAFFWGLVVLKAHELQKNIYNKEARGLVASQKFTALSFLLETAFWFMLIVPGTPLSAKTSELARWIIVGLFSVQILPAGFAWLWWTNRLDDKKDTLDIFQTVFAILVVSTIAVGALTVIIAAISSLP